MQAGDRQLPIVLDAVLQLRCAGDTIGAMSSPSALACPERKWRPAPGVVRRSKCVLAKPHPRNACSRTYQVIEIAGRRESQ
jgi:hypothetical protein